MLAHCVPPLLFPCAFDAECAGAGEAPLCTTDDRRPDAQQTGRCSRSDGTCPSGRRYSAESACVPCGGPYALCCSNACHDSLACANDNTCTCIRELQVGSLFCALRTQGDIDCSGITGRAEDPTSATGQHFTPVPRRLWSGERAVAMALGPPIDPFDPLASPSLVVSTESGHTYLARWSEPPLPLPIPAFRSLVTFVDAAGPSTWGITLDGRLFHTPSLTDVSQLSVHLSEVEELTEHCARTASGEVWCWHRLPLGGTQWNAPIEVLSTPERDESLTPSLALQGSSYHLCSRTPSGHVMCRGRNGFGELGSVTPEVWAPATEVTGLDEVTELAQGGLCARRANGATWCWGRAGGLAKDFSKVRTGSGDGYLAFETAFPRFSDRLVTGDTTSVCGRHRGQVVCMNGDDSRYLAAFAPRLDDRHVVIPFSCE